MAVLRVWGRGAGEGCVWGGPADVSRHENKLECVLNNAARDSREEEERDLLAILDKMGVR